MGTGHQLKYKWTMFALDALLTAVTKRITNSNLLMNCLVGRDETSFWTYQGTRHKHSESKTQSETYLSLWVESFILSRYAFPVRMCLSSHTFCHYHCQSHSLGSNSESSRTPWYGSHDLRGLECATSTQIPVSASGWCPSGLPPPPALPIKVSVLILALFCYTHGHESALLRIALVRPLRSRERCLINNTALLTPGLVAGKTDANRQ